MSAQENDRGLQEYLINQSFKAIDYEWEILHHREMHEAYERSLMD